MSALVNSSAGNQSILASAVQADAPIGLAGFLVPALKGGGAAGLRSSGFSEIIFSPACPDCVRSSTIKEAKMQPVHDFRETPHIAGFIFLP
jgi:hypothetical protein